MEGYIKAVNGAYVRALDKDYAFYMRDTHSDTFAVSSLARRSVRNTSCSLWYARFWQRCCLNRKLRILHWISSFSLVQLPFVGYHSYLCGRGKENMALVRFAFERIIESFCISLLLLLLTIVFIILIITVMLLSLPRYYEYRRKSLKETRYTFNRIFPKLEMNKELI